MNITGRVINRPTTVLIIFVVLVGMAIYMLPNIAVDLYPEADIPVIVVTTVYQGAGPEEVEQSVTEVLEGQLSNVSNLKNITSRSSEGYSLVLLEFAFGVDMDEAANDIRDKLEFVENILPDDAENPTIYKLDPNTQPVMNLVVKGDRSPDDLKQIAEEIIQPRLERIDGVSRTSISGGREKIVRVEISQNRLDAYNLTLSRISQVLASQNIQLGAGEISQNDKNYQIRTDEYFKDIEEIKNVVIDYKTGDSTKLIRLKDVADVFEGYEDEESTVYINGEPGVYIAVQKESGTNSVQVSNNVKNQISSINQYLPQGIEISVISDSTGTIRETLDQILQSLAAGITLAMLVLLLILRNLKSTIIIGISIPISIMITIMFMYFFDLTLNTMTLTGLILGLGMVVDSSIVVLENIFRYRERGSKLKPAALLGSREMTIAISASTLTTVCVFIPVIIFRNQLEMIGQIFSHLAFTVIIALLSSLIIAITLVPVLSSKYLKLYSRKQKPLKNRILKWVDTFLEGIFRAIENGYRGLLSFFLKNKILLLSLVLILLILSFQQFSRIGMNLFPEMAEDTVELEIELPVGTEMNITNEVLNQLQDIIKEEVHGYTDIVITAGSSGFFGNRTSYKGSIEIILPELGSQIDDMSTVKEKLRSHFNDFPGVIFSFSQMHRIGSSEPVDIMVKSDDLEKAKETAEKIKGLIEKYIPQITEPSIDLEEGLPEIEVVVDREKAYSFGLDMDTIANEISASIDGITATRYRVDGDEIDVLVILKEKERSSVPDLENIFVMGANGERISVSNFAHFEEDTGPVTINREDEIRTIHLTGGLAPGFDLTQAEQMLRNLIDTNIIMDEDLRIEFSGDIEDMQKYIFQLIIVLIIAVILVFSVMASLFESLLDPFIIFLTIPLMFIGVVWLYTLMGISFSIFSIVGLVVLVGIVVNNGIVLVDYTNLLRERGMPVYEACIEAGFNRFRPIIMTSLTTILGMTPMAFFPGEGSELVQPIGLTIVGGMLISTIMTLFVTPVLYAVFNRNYKNNKKKKERDLKKLAVQEV